MEKSQLIKELASLENHDWFDVLDKAKSLRQEGEEKNGKEDEPRPGISKKDYAAWIARRHLASDPGIREVVFLPTDSPSNVIRLLEVNSLLTVPEEGAIEAVDFSPHIEGIDFQVHVADITPNQWDQVNKGKDILPEGWSIKDSHIIGRKT